MQVEYWLEERILLALGAWVCYNDNNWGCDELVKRIPCRVVRSVPFEKGADASRVGRWEGEQWLDRGVDFGEAGFASACNSGGCTFRAGSMRAGLEASAVGLLLDCLA